MFLGQRCGTVSKATAYKTGISSGKWFMSQMFHFQSSCPVMAWEKQLRMARVLGSLLSMWVSWRKLALALLQLWLLWPSGGYRWDKVTDMLDPLWKD